MDGGGDLRHHSGKICFPTHEREGTHKGTVIDGEAPLSPDSWEEFEFLRDSCSWRMWCCSFSRKFSRICFRSAGLRLEEECVDHTWGDTWIRMIFPLNSSRGGLVLHNKQKNLLLRLSESPGVDKRLSESESWISSWVSRATERLQEQAPTWKGKSELESSND